MSLFKGIGMRTQAPEFVEIGREDSFMVQVPAREFASNSGHKKATDCAVAFGEEAKVV